MKTAADLHAIAAAVNTVEDRKSAIIGMCESRAEAGEFLAEFSRSEYLYNDFEFLKKLGYRVTVRQGSIYVYWAEPIVANA